MPGEGVNTITVLERPLLLVEVGGGAETHMVRQAEGPSALPAVERDRIDDGSWSTVPSLALYDLDALTEQRWEPTTLCGRRWQGMAAGESGPLRRWHDTSLAPTCRSCLRVLDTWFPESKALPGIELLAAVIAERVQEFGSTCVTNVPAQHLEATRRAARRHLRAKGFRSTTHLVNDVLHVLSDDAHDAIDPELKRAWVNEAMSRITLPGSPSPPLDDARQPIDWHTWVVD